MAKMTRTTRSKPSSFTYSLPAIRAIQAGQEYFTTAVPYSVLGKLLDLDRNQLESAPLDRDRIKSIADFIVRNIGSYVLPAITISIDGEYAFTRTQPENSAVLAGTLLISINTSIWLIDGRYRAMGIAEALRSEPSLCDESVSVVIFLQSEGSDRKFGDIKANQRKAGRSERIVSDPCDLTATITRGVIAKVKAFTDSIEMAKTTISNRSKNLFTFSALYQANEILLANHRNLPNDVQLEIAIQFWLTIQDAMPDWTSETPRVDLRKQTVHAHGVILCAIATVGADMLQRYPKTWKRTLAKLKSIDWSRNNTKLWEGRAMLGGRMTKSAASIELSSQVISKKLGTG